MIKKYMTLKPKYPDAIILLLDKDFYITYKEDAKIVSEVLSLKLEKYKSIDCCYFGQHRLDTFLSKLVQAGHRVAVCQELESQSKKQKL